jgi:hypothetical protein
MATGFVGTSYSPNVKDIVVSLGVRLPVAALEYVSESYISRNPPLPAESKPVAFLSPSAT